MHSQEAYGKLLIVYLMSRKIISIISIIFGSHCLLQLMYRLKCAILSSDTQIAHHSSLRYIVHLQSKPEKFETPNLVLWGICICICI